MMKETIILSSINSRELLKSLAIKDYNFFNTRILNANELAKEALIRSSKTLNLKKINTIEKQCFVYKLLKEIDYFKNSSFLDANNIVSQLDYARKLCRNNEEEKINEVLSNGEFKQKNDALLDIYNKYKKYLKDNNLTDEIEIINYAINNVNNIDAEFIILNETPLEPLEEELLKAVSNNKYFKKTIKEFIDNKETKNVTYTNAYGTVNEVEYILGYIGNEKIKYDNCTVVLLDNSYTKYFINYKDNYDIPMTFEIGQDLSLSNSFKILTLLDRWNNQYNAINSLNDLIYAPEFNTNKFWNNISSDTLNDRTKSEIINTIGNLKLSIYKNDKLENYKNTLTDKKAIDNYQYIEKVADELYKGYSYIIQTYTNIENEILENKAIKTICSYIDDYFKYLPDKNIEKDLPLQLDDIISNLSNKKIMKEASKPGCIHITDLNGGLSCIREHMFICGLNAKSFPGSPSENYLLLDSDLEKFNEDCIKSSNNKIKLNKKLLEDVFVNAMASGSNVHLSYSGFSIADIKAENPSSMLYELFKIEKKGNVTTQELEKAIGEQHSYFNENISSLYEVGKRYKDGEKINVNIIEDLIESNASTSISNRISPSSADIFFTCEKRFYLNKILGIVEPEEDDPFKTVPDNDMGTLVHECMEDYGNNPNWNKEEFMNNADNKFEAYFNQRIPLHLKDKENIKTEYLRMAEIGYNNDPKDKEVYASEKYLGPYLDPITGLTFGGIVDRIEKLENGKYRIVDYKTYKEKKNIEGDINSCFQVVLYAYILENDKDDPKEIEDCEYRYLRMKIPPIVVGYHDLKELLKNKLQSIKNALDTGEFNYAKNPDEDCTYCKFKNLCGLKKEKK